MSISVASERLFAERIFELRSDDEGERGLGRSEGGMSISEITEYKGPETMASSADGQGWIQVAQGGANSRKALQTMLRVFAAGTHWC